MADISSSIPELTPPDWRLLIAQTSIPFRYKEGHIHHTWAKTHFSRPELYLQPQTVEEIQHIVHTARRCRRKLTVIGSGHSPSDMTSSTVPSNTWLVNLDNFNRVLDDNPDTHGFDGPCITVEAGIRIYHLIAELNKRGLGLPSMGSIMEQSIAGAIATATHGSSLRHGLLSENIVSLRIMLSDGKSYTCAHDKNRELFEAALVSLGGLGIITHVTYAAVPQYRLHWKQEIRTLEHMLESWDKGLWDQKEFSRAWWFPYSERAIVWRAEKIGKVEHFDEETKQWSERWEAGGEELGKPPYSWYGTWMGYHAYQMMLWVARWIPWLTPYVERFVFRTQYGWEEGVIGEAVQQGEEALLLDCLFSQYVNEWAIPLHHGPAAISRLRAWLFRRPYSEHQIPISPAGVYVHAPIEVRVTDSSLHHATTQAPARARALLDTSCPDGPTLYLNATLYRPYLSRGNAEMRRRYYTAFEWLMREYGGKPHWGKNFVVGGGGEVEKGVNDVRIEGEDGESVKALPGEGEGVWDEMYGAAVRRWRAVRKRVDPDGVFRTGWLDRTVLAGEGTGENEEGDRYGEASTVLVGVEEVLEFVPDVE
ncbi:D-arabinono-1,4-lactone oxidase-domain-containing protein [Kalaharituber pfeilii]|nr:D-arabinono-1,4-lactone oxidase-domain-containing protein [Kalaharituber pfeilii]